MSDPSAAMRCAIKAGPAPGSRWRHYKGPTYVVVGVVLREGDLAPLVVYRPEAKPDDVLWCRPLCEWGQVVKVEYGRPVRRYQEVG